MFGPVHVKFSACVAQAERGVVNGPGVRGTDERLFELLFVLVVNLLQLLLGAVAEDSLCARGGVS